MPTSCRFVDHLHVFYTVDGSGAGAADFVIILRAASCCRISALRHHQFTENQLAKAEQIVQLRPHIFHIFFRASCSLRCRFFYDPIQDSHLKSAKISMSKAHSSNKAVARLPLKKHRISQFLFEPCMFLWGLTRLSSSWSFLCP